MPIESNRPVTKPGKRFYFKRKRKKPSSNGYLTWIQIGFQNLFHGTIFLALANGERAKNHKKAEKKCDSHTVGKRKHK